MAERRLYHYTPNCDIPGCGRPATRKVAAPWSDGSVSELKNYGVYCTEHAAEKLTEARRKQRRTRLFEGETIGDVTLYQLSEGRRDAELIPATD